MRETPPSLKSTILPQIGVSIPVPAGAAMPPDEPCHNCANLRKALRLAATRLEILAGRMRGCHEETGRHELMDEAEMFCDEARAALAPHPATICDNPGPPITVTAHFLGAGGATWS